MRPQSAALANELTLEKMNSFLWIVYNSSRGKMAQGWNEILGNRNELLVILDKHWSLCVEGRSMQR